MLATRYSAISLLGLLGLSVVPEPIRFAEAGIASQIAIDRDFENIPKRAKMVRGQVADPATKSMVEEDRIQADRDSITQLCDDCGKPVRKSRKGSFTAWIFESGSCRCKVPSVPKSESRQSSRAGIAQRLSADSIPDLGKRYEVLDLLGRGGMGSVYKVKDRQTRKTLAVKVLKEELAGDNVALMRFKQEAEAVSKLTHASVVPVLGEGESEAGAPYIVMGFVDGENLLDVLASEGSLGLQRAMDIFLQVCDVMSYAHEKGVVHRDLKPSNIMLTRTEGGAELVHLVDFGIAKVISNRETMSNLTQTGDIFGSPIYMSPEQCEGEELDHLSDVYSFGCVMYEVLSGYPPFDSQNPLKTMMGHLQETPRPFARVTGKKIPANIEAVVLRCLEKQKENRYVDFDALKSDLVAVQEGRDLSSVAYQASNWWQRGTALLVDSLIVGLIGALSYMALGLIGAPMLLSANPSYTYMNIVNDFLPGYFWGGYLLGVMQAGFGFTPVWLIYDTIFAPQHALTVAVYSRLEAVLLILASWLYYSLWESSRYRGTPGKMLMRLTVVDDGGRRISFGRASLRFVSKTLVLLQPIPLTVFFVVAYFLHMVLQFQTPIWLKFLPAFWVTVCLISALLLAIELLRPKEAGRDQLPAIYARYWHDLISRTSVVDNRAGRKRPA